MKSAEFVDLLNSVNGENVWKKGNNDYQYPMLVWQEYTEKIIEKELTKIAVTKAPNNLNYIAGQNFDKTGMIVTATYNDGTSKEVINYTVTDGNNLAKGKTSVTISYTENGVTKTTKQNITVTEKLELKIEEYTENEEDNNIYMQNISPNTTIDDMTRKIKTNGKIEIYKGTEEVTDRNMKIATGMEVRISLNNEVVSYKTVIKGDIDGDGDATINDILQINKHRLNKSKLENEYLKAADIIADEIVNIMDILQINKYRLGKIDSL